MVSDPEGSSADLYKRGNECFVSEDYDRAIELYTAAVAQDPGYVEVYAAKAQAYIKSERFQLAKKEADRGIDLLRGPNIEDDRSKQELKKCLQRSGVASFHLGKYAEAKNTFSEALKIDHADKGISQWVAWCDEKILKFGPDASKKEAVASGDQQEAVASGDQQEAVASGDQQEAVASGDQLEAVTCKDKVCDRDRVSTSDTPLPSQSPAAAQKPAEATVAESAEATAAESADAAAESSGQPNLMPVPKIKHDWYQTETHVIVEVRIKNLKTDEVRVDFEAASLSVSAKLVLGSDYSLELDLAHPVVPDQSSYRVLSTKLEIKLRKVEGVRWSALEGDGSTLLSGVPVASSTGGVKAPYASGRDWSKVEKLLEKEIDEKKEGEAALNEMFQKIYADANDDVRKAMNKSFMESGGTVLSTNWSEIGKEKVEVKPPDGLEFKKWD